MAFSTGAFRSVEEWKTAIITLPDTHFFDLMRGILGNIQSPFNKQRLVDDLAAFLSNKNIQKTIAAYIDQDDHKIIAAISVLNEPDRQELAAFFSGEYPYAKVDLLVINLAERLLVYRMGNGRLSLNPLLKKILLPFAADSEILFPYTREAAPKQLQPPAVFDDVFLASFITLIAPEKNIARGDGSPLKNLSRKIQKIFPVNGGGTDVFVPALRCIGLLTGDQFNYSGQKLLDFSRLTEAERFAYCAAGFYISLTEDAEKALLPQKTYVQYIASIVVSVLYSLDKDNIYPASTLRRLIEAAQAARTGGRDGRAEVNKPLIPAVLLEAMEKTALLEKGTDGYQKRIDVSSAGPVRIGDASLPVIAFNSVFSFVLLPEITFQDIMLLAPFCEVADANRPPQFKLTQISAARGFNGGIGGKTMVEILKKLSASHMDAGLEAAVYDWEKKHSEVVIMDGISLVLSEGRRYIARTEQLEPHIVFSPSPGVYLLDFTEKDEAVAALKKAGMDMVSEPRRTGKPESILRRKSQPFFVSFPAQTEFPVVHTGRQLLPARSDQTDKCAHTSAGEYKKRFMAVLARLKLSQTEREELAARIDRRLVISPAQISGAFMRYEKREVCGLDYAGKLALVKQALLSNETLEIIMQDSDGTEKYIRGVPLTLEKNDSETVLSVKPLEEGAETSACIKILMGKIRLIRRIKRSLFEREGGEN
jgi:hypothetical protein